jgi:hypothetical protein
MFAMNRPRLRDFLTVTENEKVTLDIQQGTWESYIVFCQRHQFPNIMNELTKNKLYFLASQIHWPWEDYVSLVTGHDGEITKRVQEYPVSQPDLHILHNCISRLKLLGRPPFPELVLFKKHCFVNFPVSQATSMNLAQFLQLYVCIYQHDHIWRDLWRMQGVLFSPQVLKDCENFAAKHEFNSDAFMELFLLV